MLNRIRETLSFGSVMRITQVLDATNEAYLHDTRASFTHKHPKYIHRTFNEILYRFYKVPRGIFNFDRSNRKILRSYRLKVSK